MNIPDPKNKRSSASDNVAPPISGKNAPDNAAQKKEQHEPFARAATEDDDGYDPWSDRVIQEPFWERDPWS